MFWLAIAFCVRAQEAIDPANIRHPIKTDWTAHAILIGVVATIAPAIMYVYAAMFFCHFISKGGDTVNTLYYDIRYNSKIRYNVNFVSTNISAACMFSLTDPCYSLGKHTFWIFVRIASPRRFLQKHKTYDS